MDTKRSAVSVVFLFFSALIISSVAGLLAEWSSLDFGYLVHSGTSVSLYLSAVSIIFSVIVLYGVDVIAAVLLFYFIGKGSMVSGTNSILNVISIFFGSALGLGVGTYLVLLIYSINFPLSSLLFLGVTSPYFAALLVSSFLGLALGVLKKQRITDPIPGNNNGV